LEYYQTAFTGITEKPFFGHGTGSVSTIFAQKATQYTHPDYHALQQILLQSSNPHNEILNIGIQLGLTGIAIYILWLVALAKHTYLYRIPPTLINISLSLKLMQGVLITMIVAGLVNATLFDFTEGSLYCLCFGLMMAIYPSQRVDARRF
jgi:O-antigen ligase